MLKASISTTLYLHLCSLVFMAIFSKLLLSANSRTHPADVQVLEDLKKGVDPLSIASGSCLSSWDFSMDPCDNIFTDHFTCGLRCDRAVSGVLRVTEITVDPIGYSGYLSSLSWNLPFLNTLDVSDNSFSGLVPESFSNLTRLRRLGLSGNSFTGQIPSVLGSLPHLEELYLDNNHLHGTIPSSFNNLTRLKRLEIQLNYISGEFPDLSSLKNLYFVDASDNNVSGGVPSTLPLSLVDLSLRNNKLRGNIPNNIDKIRFLQVLDLSHNMLCGALSSVLFKHPSLEQLTLSYNKISSLKVPGDKGLNSSLIALDLSYNKLRGLLPAFMASMPKLTALSLEHNEFTGMIPAQYAVKAAVPGNENTSSFERLLLGGNYLFGPIPGPLMGLKPGSADVSLVDNCLYRCPDAFFFCRGRDQKSLVDCKTFGPTIP
ncbi:Salt tolerance 2, putative isoform 1 [Hibiscus syriacus]|uniref:Salt tolerance 2, putative isoform 1 n=1 Tax=Hibiscus syriacus TaxID=106335 RepID=A0A6A3CNR3_HIBSY|nr:MDIS1-interacting receptor like kinase 1-like [Hibiscus syriacus]KAE8729252.1 Salt tolerance 2, putative isoform 1 [Hibiscus syriacus]